MIVIGVFFVIVVVKYVYGGLGFNIFNFVMIVYVVLFIFFFVVMSFWLVFVIYVSIMFNLLDLVLLIFSGYIISGYDVI